MNIRYYFNRLRTMRSSDANDQQVRTETLRVISRYTQDRAILSRLVAFYVRITETKDGREELEKVLGDFATPEQLLDHRRRRQIIRDIYYSKFFYRMRAEEYFRYHFEDLSPAGRRSYVSEWEIWESFASIMDSEESRILEDKYQFYQNVSSWFKREAIRLSGDSDRDLFIDFCSRHTCFFVKPLSSCGGRGVRRLTVGPDGDAEALFQQLLADGSCILEEPIRQREEMARFHPESINTIRIVTARINGQPELVQTSVRMGVGSSVVDNGCLSSSVDLQSGIITTPGRAAHSKGLYLFHPDTGMQILGSQIPEWGKLLEQTMEQFSHFPRQRVIGWDMAYSDAGWIVVEANAIPDIQILAGNGIGMRRVLEEIIH